MELVIRDGVAGDDFVVELSSDTESWGSLARRTVPWCRSCADADFVFTVDGAHDEDAGARVCEGRAASGSVAVVRPSAGAVLRRVCAGELTLADCPGWAQADKAVVSAAIARAPAEALQALDPALPDYRAAVLEAVTREGLALRSASADVKADREVVAAAVRQDWRALEHAAPCFAADKEIVLLSVLQGQAQAMQYACPALRADRDVIMASVFIDCCS